MKSADYTALLRRREVVLATISGNSGDKELVEGLRAELKVIDERCRRHTKGEPDEAEKAPETVEKTPKKGKS
jgi:hypothetical protein